MHTQHAPALAAAVLLCTVLVLPACECGWCRKGFSCDVMVVTVHDGVTREQVDRMNAEIHAHVIDTDGKFYGMQLPDDVDACDAMGFYGNRPEVNSVLPDSPVYPR
jgi:hypothetical protein